MPRIAFHDLIHVQNTAQRGERERGSSRDLFTAHFNWKRKMSKRIRRMRDGVGSRRIRSQGDLTKLEPFLESARTSSRGTNASVQTKRNKYEIDFAWLLAYFETPLSTSNPVYFRFSLFRDENERCYQYIHGPRVRIRINAEQRLI